MEVEKYFELLGWRNKWILKWFIIITIARNWSTSFSMLSFQFTSTTPKSFHCKLIKNLTKSNQIPKEEIYGKLKFSQCLQYINKSISNSTIKCINGYDYYNENEDIITSTVTDWDLVCDRAILNGLATSAFFGLSFIGSIISCTCSDKFGRKIVFLITFIGLNISELLIGLVPTVYAHILLKMAAGIFQQGCFVIGMTMILEMFSIGNRANFCLIDALNWSISCLFLDLFAYLIRYIHWRYYYILSSLFILFPFCFVFYYLPESIRWLYSKNRISEAKKILLEAGRYSNPPLTLKEIEIIEKETLELNNLNDNTNNIVILPQYNFIHIFCDKLLLRYQLINTFIWFTTALTFYGLQVKVVEIGNTFINFLLMILFEIPANFFSFPLVNHFGRKLILGIFLILTMLFLLIGFLLFLYLDNIWPATIMFLIGKMINTAVFVIIFMHAGEFFPTTLRSTAIGLGSSSARMGASVAALIFQIGGEKSFFPFILTILMNFISSILVFCLPETYKWKLPNTIEEIREWTKGKPFIRIR